MSGSIITCQCGAKVRAPTGAADQAFRCPRCKAPLGAVASGAAHRHIGGWSVYSSTKRAGEAFIEALAAQHAGDGRIRAAVVQPGVLDTGMQERLREYAATDAYFPERDRFVALHREGELLAPADAARRVIADYLGTVRA